MSQGTASPKQQRKAILSKYRNQAGTESSASYAGITAVARGTSSWYLPSPGMTVVPVQDEKPQLGLGFVKKIDFAAMISRLQEDLQAEVHHAEDKVSLTLEDGTELILSCMPLYDWLRQDPDSNPLEQLFEYDEDMFRRYGKAVLCSISAVAPDAISQMIRVYALAWHVLHALALQAKVEFVYLFHRGKPDYKSIEKILKARNIKALLLSWVYDTLYTCNDDNLVFSECLTYAGLPELEADYLGENWDHDAVFKQIETMLDAIFSGALMPQDGELYAVEDGQELRMQLSDSKETLSRQSLKIRQVRDLQHLVFRRH